MSSVELVKITSVLYSEFALSHPSSSICLSEINTERGSISYDLFLLDMSFRFESVQTVSEVNQRSEHRYTPTDLQLAILIVH